MTSIVGYLQATAPTLATELTRERLKAMKRIAELEIIEQDSNDAGRALCKLIGNKADRAPGEMITSLVTRLGLIREGAETLFRERIAEFQGERDAARARVTNLDLEIVRLNEFFTTSASLRALRERDDVIANLGLKLAEAQRALKVAGTDFDTLTADSNRLFTLLTEMEAEFETKLDAALAKIKEINT